MGRKPSIKPGVARHIDKLADQGMNKTRIAATVGVSRHAVTRYLHGHLTHYRTVYQAANTPSEKS